MSVRLRPPASRVRMRALGSVFIALLALLTVAPISALAVGDTLSVHRGLRDRDYRTGDVAPTQAQLATVSSLGATATWNRFGTPSTLVRSGSFLASGISAPSAEAAARQWITQNRSLFRLATVSTGNLETVSVNRVHLSNAYIVLLRQAFGAYRPVTEGLISVGVRGSASGSWRIAYVGSSSIGTQAAPAAPTLSAKQAWQKAAQNIGRPVVPGDIQDAGTDDSWTLFRVDGFGQDQRARVVAVGIPGAGVRTAYETILLDVRGGQADAFTVLVDGSTGAILSRVNNENQLADDAPDAAPAGLAAPSGGAFEGAYVPPTTCGPDHEFEAPVGSKSIVVVASALVGTNDIVLNLVYKEGAPTIVASSDTGTSPEAVTYSPSGGVPAGTYAARVCPFDPPTVPALPPYTYAGTYVVNDAASPSFPFPPKWKYFRANPNLDSSDSDTRRVGCWGSGFPAPCQFNVRSDASRAPWDHIVNTNTPSFTTIGNNAISGEAWLSPLTPAEQYRPSSANREYIYPWTDQWNDEKCSTAVFASPERNDIDAATAGLFAQHDRMHDWSYFLGFTETAFNLQVNNFGNTSPDRENDPEIGNSQAGAIDGGPPSYVGRDNANQITLNDGIPGITNMYLWQPIAAGFYAPCSDGDYDMSVIAHEYGHAIQNRMAAGPDAGLTGAQARSMGESWSDLTAIEYLAEYDYYGDLASTAGLNRFAVGPYVTGSLQKGIRNYGMNDSPLNYSDLEYDPNGVTSPHADGEIWSATNFDIRKALIAKYNGSFPASDLTLQRRCGDGEIPADLCPGNRRWVQIFHSAFLLLASGAASMVDARNAYLGADMMLFGGANTPELWKAFAARGLGANASSMTVEDLDPAISFESPLLSPAQHAKIRFEARQYTNEGGADITNAEVYVGRYEARAVPIADTDPTTPLKRNARFVPGTYDFLVVAPGYGHFRFRRTLTASANTFIIRATLPKNWASGTNGADATAVAVTDDGINRSKLIDDSEATNWASLDNATGVEGSQVTVDLGGGSRLVGRVRVSAFLRPQNTEDPGDPEDAAVGDTDPQSRFTALRQFEIFTCTASPTNADCTTDVGFTKIFMSAADAFPGGQPRPLAPDLQIREFDVPDTQATHVRLRVVTNQCTGGPAYQDEQDADPLNVTDCSLGSVQDENVRAAELQVISAAGATAGIEDPVVAMSMDGPLTAARGTNATYKTTYTNLGPAPSSQAKLIATLPAGVDFVSATNGGVYDASKRTVTWSLGTVAVGVTGNRSVTIAVPSSTAAGTVLLTQAEFKAPLTVANPAAVATTVL